MPMILDDNELPDSGDEAEDPFMPLPMLGMFTSVYMLETEDEEGEAVKKAFVYVRYTDLGGVKPCWFPPDIAIKLGQDLIQKGKQAKAMMPTLYVPPESQLIVPGRD